LDIEHGAPPDLDVYLDAPRDVVGNPKSIVMTSDNPGPGGSQFTGTTFDSEAIKKIATNTTRRIDGRFHPEGSFDQNFRGIDPSGTWRLRICDDTNNGITGTLNWWTLEVVYQTAADDGSDILQGGGSGTHDLIDYAARTADVTVTVDGVVNDGQAGEGDSIDASMDDLYAGLGDDLIQGNNSPNDLRGHQGNDDIYGFDAADKFRGGEGNDYIEAGGGNDQNIHGNAGNDELYGQAGNDKLFGEDGDDILDGGTETDTLIGGPGNDTCTAGEDNQSCELP